MEIKHCPTCKTDKSTIEFYKKKDTKDGFRSQCKECEKKYKQLNSEHFKEYRKKYVLENKDKIQKWFNDNIEKVKKYNKKYNIEKKEEIAKNKREYYEKNKDKILQYKRKYRQTDIGIAVDRNNGNRRRAVINNDLEKPKSCELKTIISNTKNCYWCGIKFSSKVKKIIDHYIPIKLGGGHNMQNIVISCYKCNSFKRAKDPYQFANSLGRLL